MALRGEQVVLVPLAPEHAERLRELHTTPEVARWWQLPADDWPLEPDEELEKLVITVDGEVGGYVQFAEEPDPDARHADIDIFLGPDHHGRGVGTDAMRTIVRHLTEDRGHHRVTLGTSPANARAIHVYEKVGFRAIGVATRSARNTITGEWEDELLMELVVR